MFKMTATNNNSSNNNNNNNSHIIKNHLDQKSAHVEPCNKSSCGMRMRVRGRGIVCNDALNVTAQQKGTNINKSSTRRTQRVRSASVDDLQSCSRPRGQRDHSNGNRFHHQGVRKISSSMIELPVDRHASKFNNSDKKRRASSFQFRLRKTRRNSTISLKPQTANLIFKITRGFRSSAKFDAVRFL